MKLKKTIKDAIVMIGTIIIALACALLFIIAFIHGMDKQEIVTCNKLVAQSQEIDTFFISKTQDMMCKQHGIVIDAYVDLNVK